MTIKAIVHEGETGGYWAEVPSMRGCYTQGGTMEELVANLQEAIELWLEPDEVSPHDLERGATREISLVYTPQLVA